MLPGRLSQGSVEQRPSDKAVLLGQPRIVRDSARLSVIKNNPAVLAGRSWATRVVCRQRQVNVHGLTLLPVAMSSLSGIQARIEERKRKLADGNSAAPAKRWRTKGEIEAEAARGYLERQKAKAVTLTKNLTGANGEGSGIGCSPLAQEHDRDSALDRVETSELSMQAPKSNPDEGGGSLDAAADGQHRRDPPPLKKDEVVRRLRAFGEAATLFGEDVWDRFQRLRALELARGGESRGQMNIFQNKLREMQRMDAARESYAYSGVAIPQPVNGAAGATPSSLDADTARDTAGTQPPCREDYVYQQMQRWVRLWEGDVSGMPVDVRRTNQGRMAAATLEQTKEWLKPLTRQLRKRRLAANILRALVNIFEAVEEREYVRANSHYYEQLAIGNAPWPMGATMVGIHARAAREKIGEDKIAHVMNDEKSRKYIQGVKRLVTLAQRHFPTDPSKMIRS
jgi:pre-mRNA-splicing factor 18